MKLEMLILFVGCYDCYIDCHIFDFSTFNFFLNLFFIPCRPPVVTEAVLTAVSSRRQSSSVSEQYHRPRRSNSVLPPQTVTASPKTFIVQMLGLFETPFLIFTTLVWTNCPLFLCLCHRLLCCWWWWKETPGLLTC